MGIATAVKQTADAIVGSYDTRIAALGNLVGGVHDTLNGLASDRRKSSKEQAAKLAGLANGMARKVGRMLREFQSEHNAMAADLGENLKQFDSGIENDVAGLLRGFSQAHGRMSRKLRGDLESYASGIARETQRLLGGFRREQGQVAADVKAAHAAWRGMTKSMAARRRGTKPAATSGRPRSRRKAQ